ncbi:MAG: TonB-dependent receptor plug domain-containing protein, partial [Bacteroidota bacterium]
MSFIAFCCRVSLMVCALVVGNLCVLAQEEKGFVLSGHLLDSTSNERLIGGYVAVKALELGTYTDEHGFFSLRLPSETVSLVYGATGYATRRILLNLLKDSLIQLYVTPLQLATVEVVAEDESAALRSTQMSTITLSAVEAERMPALAGEVDILKVLQLMPGVQGGNEGNAGMYVRGGGVDQNLILLDGVPIYNPTHLFGFLSNFNADAISHIELIKGGFPARYGGRLSSVLDVRLKDGNMKQFGGSASVGLLSSRLTLEGPLKKDKASFVFSARYAYPDLYIRPISR